MKHSVKVTLILILFFIISQLLGLFILSEYISPPTQLGESVGHSDLPFMERPDLNVDYSFLFIIGGVFAGTLLLLTLIKYKKRRLWKVWYSVAVVMAVMVALAAFIDARLAFILALIAVYFKVIKPNIIVHNISELFVYGGIAAIFVPEMNILSAVLLLIIISIYDAYAVWKSKHMIKLAKFQTNSKLFAGLVVPYSFKNMKIPKLKEKSKETGHSKPSAAILGGGDLVFPLLFSGVVMEELIFNGIANAFWLAFIIPLFTAVALFGLFYYGKKGKFYPAMPFVSAGCFVGYAVMLIVLTI